MLLLSHSLSIRIQNALEKAFPEASAKANVSGAALDPQLVPTSKPEFGDFQVNGALQLAKHLQESPRAIALAIVDQLKADEDFLKLCNIPEIAGPGFINLTVKEDCLKTEIKKQLEDERLGVPFVGFSK